MKKFDFLWAALLLLIVAFFAIPSTREIYVSATKAHPYLVGFIKVAILATMGELLAIRIATGEWNMPHGIIWRFVVWGFFGLAFTLVFDVFATGVKGAMTKKLLPFEGDSTMSKLAFAFFTSSIMNLIFAPTFMAFHRVTDTYIDLGKGKLGDIFAIKLGNVVDAIDWKGFIGFVVCKTIPLFWIPAHTITFLLPGEYRVLMAAFLSIALGGILAFAKRKNVKNA